ncbi:MAG TPA: endonuclease/exonuclease/phosphatase family protein, partial [Xanthomonadales bacterium]|nr:endonuclease/exonuclease/phosphatase family protein [Xanthomonadales bacterium]
MNAVPASKAKSKADSRELKLLSFNIQAGSSVEKYRHYITRSMQHVLPHPRKARNLNDIAKLATEYDLVALQEVDARRCGFDVLPYLAKRAGYAHWYQGTTMKRRGGDFGNALLSRTPIVESRVIDLSVAMFEPRLAIEAAVAAPCGPIRVI